MGCRIPRVLILVALACGWPRAEEISGGGLRVSVSPEAGQLIGLTSQASACNWLEPNASPARLWLLEFADGTSCRDTDATLFSLQREGKEVRLSWSGFALHTPLRVTVILQERENGIRAWLEVTGLAGRALRSVRFPRLGTIRGDAAACVPEWMGIMESPDAVGARPAMRRTWEYPGILSMPWVAVIREDQGLMALFESPSILRRQFHLERTEAGGMVLDVIHEPDPRETETFSLAQIPATLRHTEGGWFGAAASYRETASARHWREQYRLRSSGSRSWEQDIAAWVWNRGTSAQVLEPAADLAGRLGLPVAVLWHWWHHCPYDAGFPEYFPPREGEDAFRQALQDARGKGVNALLYMNQRLWCMPTPSWEAEHAERWAVKGPDGAIHPEVYNIFTRTPCVPMCMGTAFWRDWYAGMAQKAVMGLGASGIYMDQACASCACWDSGHEHPPGGGAWWVEGFYALERDIRQRCGGNVALAGEGCGEAWLSSLDLMLSLQVSRERFMPQDGWVPVPLFQAVYGGTACLFGNYASLVEPPYDPLWPKESAPSMPGALLDRKFDLQFRMEQARSLAWGQQPTLANYCPELYESRPEAMAFFEQVVRLRAASLAFLREGTMLPPPLMNDRIPLIVSQLSIYAGRDSRVREYAISAAPVLCAGWKNKKGEPALVAVNITDEPRTLRADPEAWGWELPNPASVTVTRGVGAPEKPGVEPGEPFDLRLGPAEALVCVWEHGTE
ncbi:MAG TPA: DUF6259 domain-containing protein [Candidatus Hydrogenedentes bacterium]|nr:DUF6259 domain-containing protein [Candidatus Hydrogenedentota bacterium]